MGKHSTQLGACVTDRCMHTAACVAMCARLDVSMQVLEQALMR
jgi:hypothetical protein